MESLRGNNAVERVASAPRPVRAAAMEFAVDRAFTALGRVPTLAERSALQRYYEATFRTRQMPQSRTPRVGGLTGDQLMQLWVDAEESIARAADLVDDRLGLAWARAISVPAGGWVRGPDPAVTREISDRIVFPALENKNNTLSRLTELLTLSPAAARVTPEHRTRIAQGAERYINYMRFARGLVQSPAEIEALIRAWTAPGPPAYPDDNHVLRTVDITYAGRVERGQAEFDALVGRVPALQERLSPAEKMRYVGYLGYPVKERKTILKGNRSAIQPIIDIVAEETQRAGAEPQPEQEGATSTTPEPASPEVAPTVPDPAAETRDRELRARMEALWRQLNTQPAQQVATGGGESSWDAQKNADAQRRLSDLMRRLS